MTSAANDRRILHRFRAALVVELSLDDHHEPVPGTLHDVSPSGAKIRTALPLVANEWCLIHLQPPPSAGLTHKMTIRAQCVRHVGDMVAVNFDREQLDETSVLFSALVDSGLADPSQPV